MKKSSSYIKIFASNIIVLLVLLALIDPFFETSGDFYFSNISRSVNLREFPIETEFNFTPTNDLLENTQNLQKKKYFLKTDSNGFIIGRKKQTNSSAEIIFFGGSTTECKYVDWDKRFPYLVGEILREKFKKDTIINVLNAGVSGDNTMHSLIKLIAKGLPLKPKIVVMMHNINDLVLLLNTGSYWNAPDTRVVINVNENTFSVQISNLLKLFIKNFYSNIYPGISKIFRKSSNGDEWKGYRNIKSYEDDKIIQMFRESVLSFTKIAEVHGLKVILMTQGNRINFNDHFVRDHFEKTNDELYYESFVDIYKLTNNEIRNICKQENLLLVDLEKTIPANQTYFYDAVHLNSKGSQLAANIIAETIINDIRDSE